MSTPIIEQIADLVKADINTITVANGFNQTLTAVRPKRIDFKTPWNDLDVLINQVEAEQLDAPTMYMEWKQFFILTAFVIDSDEETASIDTRLNKVAADIIKKLLEDRTRDGLAENTGIDDASPFDDDDGGLSGIAVKIWVQYLTKDDDPYSQ